MHLLGWSKKLGFLKDSTAYLQRYFCTVYDYAGKADRNKGCWDPKRKSGITMHFSEIIESLNWKENAIHCSVF